MTHPRYRLPAARICVAFGLVPAIAGSIFFGCKATGSRLADGEHSGADAAPRPVSSFVKADQGRFMLDGKPFGFSGSNHCNLPLSDAFGSAPQKIDGHGHPQFPQIDSAMEKYARDGIQVLRIWPFSCDGVKNVHATPALIGHGRALNDEALQQLDYTIDAAARNGVRVIMPLVNFEPEYCGMGWWVNDVLNGGSDQAEARPNLTWSCIDPSKGDPLRKVVSDPNSCPGGSIAEPTRELFYSNPDVRQAYKNYISAFLNRVNRYNGRAFKDEPAIMAIEMANEPHTTNFYECLTADGGHSIEDCENQGKVSYTPGRLVTAWLTEMSAFVKSIDQKHLVTSGEEGYRINHQDSSCMDRHTWINNGMKGVDFAADARIPTLDYMTVHLYPDNWAVPTSDFDWFSRCVTQDRANIAKSNGKPIVLEEAGFSSIPIPDKPTAYRTDRPYYLSEMFRRSISYGFSGVMVWQAMSETDASWTPSSNAFNFPLRTVRNGREVYVADGSALIRADRCLRRVVNGATQESCMFLCPAGTSVDEHHLGHDPAGHVCILLNDNDLEAPGSIQ